MPDHELPSASACFLIEYPTPSAPTAELIAFLRRMMRRAWRGDQDHAEAIAYARDVLRRRGELPADLADDALPERGQATL